MDQRRGLGFLTVLTTVYRCMGGPAARSFVNDMVCAVPCVRWLLLARQAGIAMPPAGLFF